MLPGLGIRRDRNLDITSDASAALAGVCTYSEVLRSIRSINSIAASLFEAT